MKITIKRTAIFENMFWKKFQASWPSKSKVGGVWRKNYADFGLQVPKELYEFPDFPYPETFKCDEFPTGEEVKEYIKLYCDLAELDETCYKLLLGRQCEYVQVSPKDSGTSIWKYCTLRCFRGEFSLT